MTGENKLLTLGDLATRGLLDAEAAGKLLRPDAESEKQGPWYLRVLQAVGAWFAALFTLGFLGASGIIDDGADAIPFGIIMIAGATGLSRVAANLFVEQGLTAVSVAGHFLLTFGLWDEVDAWAAALAAVLILPFTYHFFRGAVHRLFSCHNAAFVSYGAFMSEGYPNLNHLLVGLCLLGILLFHSGRFPAPQWRPAAWSAVTILLYLLTSAASLSLFGDRIFDEDDVYHHWIAPFLVAVLLPLLPLYLQRHAPAPARLPLYAGAVILGILAFLTSPAIAASLWLFLIGHLRGDSILTWLGGIGTGISLSHYYYSLEVTLLTKSVSLIALGLGFLLLRILLQRFLSRSNPAAA